MTSTCPVTLPISIIIPTLNEENFLEGLLSFLQAYKEVEVIVADGGSSDRTLDIANRFNVLMVNASRGRGAQQNTGASLASHNTLLFLHCDTKLPIEFSKIIHAVLSEPGTAAGAFQLKIDDNGCWYRLVEWGANMRSRLFRLPYGDQALFMKKEIFKHVGGFPNQPLLEDFELVRRLKRVGKFRIAPASVSTSARRWHQKGRFKTTLMNQLILAGYLCGVSPARLKQVYYGTKAEVENTNLQENS